jgi:hypothetical protein
LKTTNCFYVYCGIKSIQGIIPLLYKTTQIIHSQRSTRMFGLLFLLAQFVISAPAPQGTIVTPFLTTDGYSALTWDSYPPGGCTKTYEIMNKAFPGADINQWTGLQKLAAVKQVGEFYNYMVIAR